MFRLFNAEGDATERAVSLDFRPARVFLVELDGRRICKLDVRRSTDGRSEIRLAMPRFGIRTICCELQPSRG
jgi:alpha-mannosidase